MKRQLISLWPLMDFRKSFQPERDVEMSLYEYKSGFNLFELMYDVYLFRIEKIS